MCEEVRTRPITLTEKGNIQLPRQHASKHVLLLGRDTCIRILTAKHFPNGIVLICFCEFVSHTHTHTHTHHRFTDAAYSRFVCVFSIQSRSPESILPKSAARFVLTPNNVAIVAPGATNLGLSPSVSEGGLAIA